MGCWKIICVRNVNRFYDMVCRIGRVCWSVEVVYGYWRVEVLCGAGG